MIERRGFDGSLLDLSGTPRARVTDHALVRFLERVEGRDLGAVRRVILDDPSLRAAFALGANGVYLPAFRVRAKLAGKTVVTFVRPERTDG